MGCICKKVPPPEGKEGENLNLGKDGENVPGESCMDHTDADEKKQPEVKPEDQPENRETTTSHLDVQKDNPVETSNLDKSGVSGKGGKKKPKKSKYYN